jgi:hypothetical protein
MFRYDLTLKYMYGAKQVYSSASIRHLIAYLSRTRPSSRSAAGPHQATGTTASSDQGAVQKRATHATGALQRCFAIGPGRVEASVYPYTIAVYSITPVDRRLSRRLPSPPHLSRPPALLCSQRAVLYSPRRQPRETPLSAPVTPRPRSLVRLHDHHRVHSIIHNHCHGWSSGALVANTAFTTAPPNN